MGLETLPFLIGSSDNFTVGVAAKEPAEMEERLRLRSAAGALGDEGDIGALLGETEDGLRGVSPAETLELLTLIRKNMAEPHPSTRRKRVGSCSSEQ